MNVEMQIDEPGPRRTIEERHRDHHIERAMIKSSTMQIQIEALARSL